MIISVNWLKKFTDVDLPIDELAILIGARLVEIEEIIDYGAKYKDVVVAKVVECRPLEGSDHLNVAMLDDGGKTHDVERDGNGYVQVVCGAPNIRKDLLVAWLPPNTVVPETYDTNEPFILGARKLRGVMSNGMIASPRELALFDEHEGILELDEDFAPGASFAESYELNDYLLDIENKSLTHRPDTFGIIGFAREVAAIQGKTFKTPNWLGMIEPEFAPREGDVEAPTVTIEDVNISRRYQAVVLSGADGAAKSPLRIQTYLSRVGVRPINAIVDVTNYLMMLTGQPLHAFDYDKLVEVGGGKADIHVRVGREGEKLELLDGREIVLTPEDIVIAAGETAIGLVGAMGGASTEIDNTTKNIIVESATFNLYNLRGTQMRHGIFSEAITRFTKGQPAELTAPVLADAVRLMGDFAGAKRVSDVAESYPGRTTIQSVRFSTQKTNDILGAELSEENMTASMRHVEFTVEGTGNELLVTPPYWRADIHIAEDIVEEVGRLYGFDNITPTLPRRDFTAVRPDNFDQVRAEVRKALVRAGVNEVLTYSFVHGDLLTKAGQKPTDSYRLVNSLSPELQYYRQTITPSILNVVHGNVKQGYDKFALFEVNKAHPKQHGMTEENVPAEVDMIALTLTSKRPQAGAAYYEAKRILDYLAASLGLELRYAPMEVDPNYPVAAPFEHRRSALVTDRKTGTFLGIVGEYKKSVVRAFKLPEHTAGFEIGSIPVLEAVQKLTSGYTPISRYPSTERDVCFQVSLETAYQNVIDTAEAALVDIELEANVMPVDIYQAEGSTKKNITIRLGLTSHEKTLTGEEVASVMDIVTRQVVAATSATVI
ncbi:MAG TPA: phenylalanine--tRNA ligase subunit beta [Candidatus Chromulinivoraceae bacterium]|nr:phenylalanine--tRNA ligase subunit beta [Candidatus Chromulinivoraceae bacterium]